MSEMATTYPPSKACAHGEDAKKQRYEEHYPEELFQQVEDVHSEQAPLNSPPIGPSLGTLEKTIVTIAAKPSKELLPTQNLASSLQFYSPKSKDSTSKSTKAKPPPCAPSLRSKLEGKKLRLAQQLSKGQITPEEYERKMCLIWDRPKLSAEGDWVMISSRGPSKGSNNGDTKPDGGRCVLM